MVPEKVGKLSRLKSSSALANPSLAFFLYSGVLFFYGLAVFCWPLVPFLLHQPLFHDPGLFYLVLGGFMGRVAEHLVC